VTVLPSSSEQVIESDEFWLRSVLSSDAFAFLAYPVEDIYNPNDGEPLSDAL
jgi:hypothetical protein